MPANPKDLNLAISRIAAVINRTRELRNETVIPDLVADYYQETLEDARLRLVSYKRRLNSLLNYVESGHHSRDLLRDEPNHGEREGTAH